jgi:LysM repeat protein
VRFYEFGHREGLSTRRGGGAVCCPGFTRRLALALTLLTLAGCGGPQSGAPAAPAASHDDGGAAFVMAPLCDGGGDDAIAAELPEEETETADKDEIDDGIETAEPDGRGRVLRHPLDNWTKEQIEAALEKDPESLGSMSIGYAHSGALFNGVQMPLGDAWELVSADRAWGTRETVDNLTHCLKRVASLYPGAARMYIGHLSARRGGHLSPHKSHQCGRDVDISYYYLPGQEKWYATARASNLDRERTWAFVRALVTDTDVELILMDRSVQRLLRQHALARGEDREWVDGLFDGAAGTPPLIRHAKGHATHLHVRFYSPLAQETGRRSYEILIKRRVLSPPSYFVRHKARSGDTLSELALKYHVPAKVIQQVNGLKTDVLKIDREYKIPQSGGVRVGPRVTVPSRRLPPEPAAPPATNAEQKNVAPPATMGGG